MKDDFDVEKSLKKFRGEPGETVREVVMAEFERGLGPGISGRAPVRFWRKPVPAYAVVALFVFFVSVAFFAGRQSAGPQESREKTEEIIPGLDVTTADDIQWCITARDLL